MKLVTNDRLRRELGRWLREAEDGADVVIVDRKQQRPRVRLVVVVGLDLDFDELEKDQEIYL